MAGKRRVWRAFICSGGGLRGCFQVGAIDWLVQEAGIVPDLVCGISTGSLQALGLTVGDANGPGGLPGRLLEVWNGLSKQTDVFRSPPLQILRALPAAAADLWHAKVSHTEINRKWMRSAYELSGLAPKIESFFDIDVIARSRMRIMVGAVDLRRGDILYFDSRTRTPRPREGKGSTMLPLASWKAVMASCSIPAYFPPVDLDGRQLVDGGVRDIAPLGIAIDTLVEMAGEAGDKDPALELSVMLCSAPAVPEVGERNNIVSILFRTIDVMCDEIVRNDVEIAAAKNELRKHAGLGSRWHHVEVKRIEPAHNVIDVLEVDPAKIRQGIQLGRDAARAVTP